MLASEKKSPFTVDRLYRFLIDEHGPRVCKDIPAEACDHVPRNFLLTACTRMLTKLADELANAKTVLPWLLSMLGASSVWIGLLVPIRESMSMLPQLAIARVVQRRPRRKSAWIWGAMIQACVLAAMGLAASTLTGWRAGAAIVSLLLVFSLARGICSVASKDVLGKTIPKTRRGRLDGYTVAVSGVLTLGAGALLTVLAGEDSPPLLFAALLGAAAVFWLLAVVIYSRIRETADDTRPGKSALHEAIGRLVILRHDVKFRRFLIVRALFVSTALAAPYYVVIARESGAGKSLGVFVVASGLASALSSAFWGRFADKSSRVVMLVAGGFASILGVVFFLLTLRPFTSERLDYIAPAAFFLLAIAHSGVRIGRKTYVVDLASQENRIDYIAVSNSIIGIVVLASGLLGVLASVIGAAGMLLILSLLGGLGVLLGAWLPESE